MLILLIIKINHIYEICELTETPVIYWLMNETRMFEYPFHSLSRVFISTNTFSFRFDVFCVHSFRKFQFYTF